MNVTKSLLEDIKTKQLKLCGHVQRMEEGRLPKMLWNGAHQEEENEVDLNLPGRKGLEIWLEKMDWWKKTGMTEATGEGRRSCQMGAARCGNIVQPANGCRKMWQHCTTCKWVQEDVATLYNLLNKYENFPTYPPCGHNHTTITRSTYK